MINHPVLSWKSLRWHIFN